MDTKNNRSKRQRWRWGYQFGRVYRDEYSWKGNYACINQCYLGVLSYIKENISITKKYNSITFSLKVVMVVLALQRVIIDLLPLQKKLNLRLMYMIEIETGI